MEEYIMFEIPAEIWKHTGDLLKRLNFPHLWIFSDDCLEYDFRDGYVLCDFYICYEIDRYVFKCYFGNYITIILPCEEFTVDKFLQTLKDEMYKQQINSKRTKMTFDILEQFLREREYLAKCSEFQEQYKTDKIF